jgi:hypothetical protein
MIWRVPVADHLPVKVRISPGPDGSGEVLVWRSHAVISRIKTIAKLLKKWLKDKQYK